jgi:protein required for attachment to host cells
MQMKHVTLTWSRVDWSMFVPALAPECVVPRTGMRGHRRIPTGLICMRSPVFLIHASLLTGGSMPTTWIITANAGRARFFSEDGPAEPLQELEDMVNNGARLRANEAETDKHGIFAGGKTTHNVGGTQGVAAAHNAGAGQPNSQYEPNQTPAEHETELFAKDLSQYLLKAQQEGRYQSLVISASPQFLGTLRSNLDAHVKAVIKQEFNKDYTQVPVHQLREQLQAAQAKSAE